MIGGDHAIAIIVISIRKKIQGRKVVSNYRPVGGWRQTEEELLAEVEAVFSLKALREE